MQWRSVLRAVVIDRSGAVCRTFAIVRDVGPSALYQPYVHKPQDDDNELSRARRARETPAPHDSRPQRDRKAR